jgi:threonine/homoserine/homoserine lactone efflux protein
MLGTARARLNGPAFALGWVLGLAALSALVVVLAGDADDPDSATATGVNWVQVAIGLLFFGLAWKQWKGRPAPGTDAEMPEWMTKVESISPASALVLGVTLSALNPKNMALTAAAAATVAQSGLSDVDTVLAVVAFVVLGSTTVAGAVLFSLVAPRRAEAPLAEIRAFMARNQAVIMMVILLVLGAKVLGDGLTGLD